MLNPKRDYTLFPTVYSIVLNDIANAYLRLIVDNVLSIVELSLPLVLARFGFEVDLLA